MQDLFNFCLSVYSSIFEYDVFKYMLVPFFAFVIVCFIVKLIKF